MITATREVAAPCERVWEVLAQGWTYTQWVVGNSRTRANSLALSAVYPETESACCGWRPWRNAWSRAR